MHGEILRGDPERLAFFAFREGVHQGLADIDVHRIAIFVFFGLLYAFAVTPRAAMSRVAPTALVQHLENFPQRLVADFAHSAGRELKAMVRPKDVAFLFEHLFDVFQVF